MFLSTLQTMLPFLTLIIAFISAVTALAAIKTSAWVAKNDSRIRLFEERMKVYRAFDNLLSEVNKDFTVSREILAISRKAFQTTPFIFSNNDLDNYLKLFIQKIIILEGLNSRNSSDNNPQLRDDIIEIQKWIVEQNTHGLELFKKHMKLLNTFNSGFQP